MITIAPIDLILRVSAAGIGGSEVPMASNAGPFVEPRLKLVGLAKGNPWCAADVAYTGQLGLPDQWPLPMTGGCAVLAEFAQAKGILFEAPERGDVFLVWHPELGRFGHTGFVVDVASGRTCTTHEGNTSGAGSREGWLKAERTRAFGEKDRFIRWVKLL